MLRLTVFHLDDDLFALTRVREHLAASSGVCEFEVRSFETEESLMAALRDAGTPKRANARLDATNVLLIDVHLAKGLEGRGVAITSALRERWTGPIVAHSNDFGSIRQCLMAGANDFVLKSESLDGLALRLFAAYRQASGTSDTVSPALTSKRNVIGDTMRAVAKRLPQIQASAIRAIHVLGESGTGKEVVAELWRDCQPDKKAPFLKVNCAAISPTLLESELFGHVRGAYTGAIADKAGYIEAASGGSLFLDEVACLTPSAQAALLRALENREVIRVGDTKARPVDVKIISASNVPLEKLVHEGLFRNDLLQRLREAEIHLPPLRERRSEVDEFIDHFRATEAGGPYTITDEARKLLVKAEWKEGNIRGLRNALRAMTEHHVDRQLSPKAIPNWVWKMIDVDGPTSAVVAIDGESALRIPLTGGSLPPFDTLTDLLLVEAIRHVQAVEGKNSLRAIGDALGIPKTTLATKLTRVRDRGLMPDRELDSLVGGKSS